jgi:aspartate carbamoyltransferase catalytic subunit
MSATASQQANELRERFRGRHIISMNDFSREEVEFVLAESARFEQIRSPLLQGQLMSTAFFEPSTRTRLSFESAMNQLGGTVLGFDSGSGTSISKGESLSDTIQMMAGYSDVIVMRHPAAGSARLAAEISRDVPILNGGDGSNQHPTQTFLDLYTIRERCGRIDGLTVGFVGDLKYGRTVHSLSRALSMFDVHQVFVSPPSLRVPAETLEDLNAAKVRWEEATDLEATIPRVDVLYVTRIQKERFGDPVEYDKVRSVYQITPEMLGDTRPGMIIMHPLPRVDEISPATDVLPQAVYFRQARNGVTVRKALLALVLGRATQ